MANQEHLDILKEGVDVWNKWRRDNKEIRPDLSNTRLSKNDLCFINLDETNLDKADLREAELNMASLNQASPLIRPIHVVLIFPRIAQRGDLIQQRSGRGGSILASTCFCFSKLSSRCPSGSQSVGQPGRSPDRRRECVPHA
jgi:hypothetical protein